MEKIEILGIPYKLIYKDVISRECLTVGQIDYLRQEIEILEGLGKEIEITTILHEVLHGILNQLGYVESSDEQLINGLSTGIYQVLKDNPLLIDRIKEYKS